MTKWFISFLTVLSMSCTPVQVRHPQVPTKSSHKVGIIVYGKDGILPDGKPTLVDDLGNTGDCVWNYAIICDVPDVMQDHATVHLGLVSPHYHQAQINFRLIYGEDGNVSLPPISLFPMGTTIMGRSYLQEASLKESK